MTKKEAIKLLEEIKTAAYRSYRHHGDLTSSDADHVSITLDMLDIVTMLDDANIDMTPVDGRRVIGHY